MVWISISPAQLAIGIVGLVISGVGVYLRYLTVENPLMKFRLYIRRPEKWDQIHRSESHITTYRYRGDPEFQIVTNWNEEIVSNFSESWVMDYPWRGADNNTSYYVRCEARGSLLHNELFVSLDGHRYFVPVPQRHVISDDEVFFYDPVQLDIARIVGKFDYLKNMEEFIPAQKNVFKSELDREELNRP
jgi:hypothetical protein